MLGRAVDVDGKGTASVAKKVMDRKGKALPEF